MFAKKMTMSYSEKFIQIRADIPETIKLVAVSKNHPASAIQEVYTETKHKIFGENKAQEMGNKHTILPEELEWHFIGHLQTNKIKYIIPYVSLIQSVDSFRLLKEINKEAAKINRIVPCLLQFHIAQEEAKYGFSITEVKEMLDTESFNELKNISINGVMGMATFTDSRSIIEKEFRILAENFKTLKSQYFINDQGFKEISMGMSDDYLIAIDAGSTIVRIGSAIFGSRIK